MKAIRNLFVLALAFVLVGGGLYEWWNLIGRWQPHPITSHEAEITKLLESSDWVSPGLTGPKLYMIAYRGAPADRVIDADFPALQKAGVDTRVIMIARADAGGSVNSTAAERSTVAELWINRRWALLQKWLGVPADAWSAPGVPPADGDVARTAVVEVGQAAIDKLTPMLKDNGVAFTYPTLIWWSKDGKMKACTCTDPHQDKYVLKDLGAN
jgi:hypothetical protein